MRKFFPVLPRGFQCCSMYDFHFFSLCGPCTSFNFHVFSMICKKSQLLNNIYLYGMVWDLEELWPQLSLSSLGAGLWERWLGETSVLSFKQKTNWIIVHLLKTLCYAAFSDCLWLPFRRLLGELAKWLTLTQLRNNQCLWVSWWTQMMQYPFLLHDWASL